jgi:hypothetical protein
MRIFARFVLILFRNLWHDMIDILYQVEGTMPEGGIRIAGMVQNQKR